jgi:hypothetical protein
VFELGQRKYFCETFFWSRYNRSVICLKRSARAELITTINKSLNDQIMCRPIMVAIYKKMYYLVVALLNKSVRYQIVSHLLHSSVHSKP